MHIFHKYSWKPNYKTGESLGICSCGKIKIRYILGSEDSTQMGRCIDCGKWTSEAYMDKDTRSWSSEDAVVCNNCYSELLSEHRI